MSLFSKPGQSSTWFEKGAIFFIVLILGIVLHQRIVPQLELHDVFRSASASVWESCIKTSGYREWLFLSSEKKALYDCVAESKDSDFQKAAAKYMLKHGKVVFEEMGPSSN